MEKLGALIVKCKTYPDHHVLSDSEAHSLMKQSEEENCVLVTTEKDWVRLSHSNEDIRRLKAASQYLPIKLSLGKDQQKDFIKKLEGLISVPKN